MARMTQTEQRTFNTATSIVTCVLAGDEDQARGIIWNDDHDYREVILFLAQTVAVNHSPESWRAGLLAAIADEETPE